MKRLTVKSNLRRERMPEWLLFILDITLDGLGKAAPLDGTYEEFEYIQWAVRSDLELLKVKNNITADLVSAESETVLFIKRGGRILVSVYIK